MCYTSSTVECTSPCMSPHTHGLLFMRNRRASVPFVYFPRQLYCLASRVSLAICSHVFPAFPEIFSDKLQRHRVQSRANVLSQSSYRVIAPRPCKCLGVAPDRFNWTEFHMEFQDMSPWCNVLLQGARVLYIYGYLDIWFQETRTPFWKFGFNLVTCELCLFVNICGLALFDAIHCFTS
jgi:hypothetical protein